MLSELPDGGGGHGGDEHAQSVGGRGLKKGHEAVVSPPGRLKGGSTGWKKV